MEEETSKRPRSLGEKIFDWGTYAGIAGIGTFLLTIPLANLFKEGARFHSFDQWMRGSVRKMGGSENIASQVANTTNFMHGGNLILIPVGIMEFFRTPIVNWLNRLTDDPTDPTSLRDVPPQTAMSIIQARLIAWSTVFCAFTGLSLAIGERRFGALLDNAGTKLCEIMKRPVKIPGNQPGQMIHSKTYNFGHTGALDVLATASSATLLYFGSHFFARKAQEKKMRQSHTAETIAADATPGDIPAATVSSITRAGETLAPAPAAALQV